MTAATQDEIMPTARSTAGEVIACHECGTVHRLPAMPNDTIARCTACDARIYIRFEATIERTLALYLAALALFLVANAFPIMSMAIAGQSNASTILDSAKALYDAGMWPLALAVGLAGCIIPLLKILGMLAVLIPLQLGRQPRWVFAGFRWVERFQPWAMMEVYLLGVIVAYVKMQDLATVQVGVAMYAFIGTIVLLAAADARFDPHAVWRRLAAQAGDDVLDPRPGTLLLGCEACDQVVRVKDAHLHGLACPRCRAARIGLPTGIRWLSPPVSTIRRVFRLTESRPRSSLAGANRAHLGNVGHKPVHYNRVDKGGHFAAWEQPELFAAELRAAFRSLRPAH